MTEFLNQVTDNDKPWLFIEDTWENIIADLKTYILDPSFEEYGDYVNRNPQWVKKECSEKYKGCTYIFGNFLNYTHAFRVITNDNNMIKCIQELVDKNKATKEYKQAKADYKKAKLRNIKEVF